MIALFILLAFYAVAVVLIVPKVYSYYGPIYAIVGYFVLTTMSCVCAFLIGANS